MQLTSPKMNPFISFCLYVAARVFVQYLRSRPNDHQVGSSLQFLLSAMLAIKRKNPLTESFLAQLDVDLESAGLDRLRLPSKTFQKPDEDPGSCGGHGLIRMAKGPIPTYGDLGVAAFNVPSQNIVDTRSTSATFDAMGFANGSADLNASQIGLPSRQRNPGAYISEMDTSPDASGDQQYSGSSTQNVGSSHTSTTAYSPQQNQLQSDPNHLAAVFDNVMNNGSAFDGVQQPGGAFIPTHNWDNNGVQGVPMSIPHGSGFNTMSGGDLGDVMAAMSDAEWNSIMEGMSGWDSGLDHAAMNVL